MASIPLQQRSIDTYGQDRYSTSINRQTKIFTGELSPGAILSFDGVEGSDPSELDQFSLSLDTTTDSTGLVYNAFINIGTGLCICNDVVIHVKEQYTLDINDPDCYLLSPEDTAGVGKISDIPGVLYNYYIVLYYQYSRSYPAPEARYFLVKNNSLFLEYSDKLLYLGTAHLYKSTTMNGGLGGYFINDIVLTTYDETESLLLFRKYGTRMPTNSELSEVLDGNWWDTTTTVNWINTSQTDSSSSERGGLGPFI